MKMVLFQVLHCFTESTPAHLLQELHIVVLLVRNKPQTAAPPTAAAPHLPTTVAATGNSNSSLTARLSVQQEGGSESRKWLVQGCRC